MLFSEKLIRLRKLNSLTQTEFAMKVGVSRQAVYKWESGQSYPEVPTLLEIKALFSISIDALLDESFEIELPAKKTRKRRKPATVEKAEEVVSATETKAENETEKVTIEEQKTEEVAEAVTAATVAQPAAKVEEESSVGAPVEKKKGFFQRLFGRK
jgi:transcriptional regulator with XRE-family HTH domain